MNISGINMKNSLFDAMEKNLIIEKLAVFFRIWKIKEKQSNFTNKSSIIFKN